MRRESFDFVGQSQPKDKTIEPALRNHPVPDGAQKAMNLQGASHAESVVTAIPCCFPQMSRIVARITIHPADFGKTTWERSKYSGNTYQHNWSAHPIICAIFKFARPQGLEREEFDMAYRNKVFVSFDGDNDMRYYTMMKVWKQNENIPFNFYDAHDINTARDTSSEKTIKRQLRERLLNTKICVVLIGESTRYLYKFVRWELEQALDLKLPIIGVNLNQYRQQDKDRCPPIIRDKLAIHISFKAAIVQHALENWPDQYKELSRDGETGAYHYKTRVYERLGL